MLEPDLCIPLRRLFGISSLGRSEGVAFRASLLDLFYHSIGIVKAKFTCLAKVFEPFGLLL